MRDIKRLVFENIVVFETKTMQLDGKTHESYDLNTPSAKYQDH